MSDSDFPHRYNASLAQQIETEWQSKWQQDGTYLQPNPGEPGFDDKKPKYYCLDMFPYPSGAGLHVGHPEGYTATDIISRYKRMRGFNVLHPMGWDAFGLPAEQYAIQTGVHPAVTTKKAVDNFRRQLQRFGFSYDWTREFGTTDPDYYRFTQWIFVQLYDTYFDDVLGKGIPISRLRAAFESGERQVRFNGRAQELSKAERTRDFGPWSTLDKATQHAIINSYRLAYISKQVVNWCPKLGTALANEEVIDGRSERGSHPVLRKPLRQWMFRITAYSDRLLAGLADVDWPEATKTKQALWIGRSEGAEVDFELKTSLGGFTSLRVYTTRPDTLFGATYMVVAPEHPLVDALLQSPLPNTDAYKLKAYVDVARNRSDLDRQTDKEKTGVFTGATAINPVNGEAIPIWIADYVLMGYGQGAIMAVPAHDDRDHAFATTFDLPIVEVVQPTNGQTVKGCFADAGRVINSRGSGIDLNGMSTAQAKLAITEFLSSQGQAEKQTNYRLRDWLFSRQRYWGEPFPIVYDEDGQHYAVGPTSLPVVLPELVDYEPEESDEPKPLLAKATDWLQTTAAAVGITDLPPETRLTRETNTMPGWAGSCWYFLRYCDPKNHNAPIGKQADNYWLGDDGVDLYIGGAEHAVLHLLYARFFHHVLHDLGHVRSPEPFKKLFHQGLITSFAYQRPDRTLVPIDEVEEQDAGVFIETATGEAVKQTVAKMSKSLKNVVNPDTVIAEYGADTFRLYEMYMGPLEASKPWSMRDISGQFRFLQRTWRLLIDETSGTPKLQAQADDETERLLHRTIAKVGEDIERLAYNTAIAALVKFVNHATSASGLTKDQASRFVRVLSPFAPHIGEELYRRLGYRDSVTAAEWPHHDQKMLVDEQIEVPVSIKGKVRSRIKIASDASKEDLQDAALADPRIQELIGESPIRKVIVVPGRMVNIIA